MLWWWKEARWNITDTLVEGFTSPLGLYFFQYSCPFKFIYLFWWFQLANTGESSKLKKYSSVTFCFSFLPFASRLLVLGGLLVWQIGSQVMEQTQFLIQNISTDVQHGNAVLVMATIPSLQDWAEFASLHMDWQVGWIINDDPTDLVCNCLVINDCNGLMVC